MFRIVHDPIIGPLLAPEIVAGGIVIFEGRVRVVNEGREVQALEYEAFDELAKREGAKILEEAKARFPIVDAVCVHRVGLLTLGEVAIRVEVSSGHRREAFEACEYIVDETKRRVPIWKKEHYVDGVTDWLHADGRRALTEAALYDRQLRVPEIGEVGQARLRAARILVVGAGGLGSPMLTYLAAAGVGHLTIVEPDTVEPSNLHRQPLYGWADAGRPKARLAAERLRKLNPFVQVEAQESRLTEHNARESVANHDLVLDGTDNFATKFLLNDACVLAGKPLVLASVHRWEGQMMLVAPGGPCFRCLWPSPPPDGCVGTCADDGVAGVVPGVLGTLQAVQALKWILGMPAQPGELTLIDLRTLSLDKVRVPKDPNCPACGTTTATWQELRKSGEAEVTPTDDLSPFLIVDIREDDEVSEAPLHLASLHLPLSRFRPDDPSLGSGAVLLVCQSGARSGRLAQQLRQEGQTRFFTLKGGKAALL